MAYNKNGNILALQRYGQTSASAYGLIDNLKITLNGNQLKSVNDAITTMAYNNSFEFKNGANATTEYMYDANGNLTKDLNKNITDIQYDFLNLPDTVTFSDGSTISYLYSADGVKLRTIHKIGSTTTTTYYCNNVVYENGVQKLLLTEEGYLSLNDSKYHYYLKDHQGNNRVVINQNGNVEETNHYYPFGGVFASSQNVQPYKYNGKELDTKKGLNWYDYGARQYDAAIGRFTTMDPMTEKYYAVSPYTYCINNPVKYIDPNGMTLLIWYKNDDGKMASYKYSGGNTGNSNSFVKAVVTAYQYNKQNGSKAGNGGGASTVIAVENPNLTINVMESTNRDYYSEYAAGGTIYWNPELGLQSDNNVVTSPATGFDHEADHAVNQKLYPDEYKKNTSTADSAYGDKEERRVITGSEQKTARANGEINQKQVTRRNHGGKSVITEGVTSNKINEVKTKEYENNRKRWISE